MKKKLLYTIAGFLLAFSLTASFASADTVNPNFWKRIGNAVNFLNSSWTLGDTSNRIAKGWFTDLDATTATIGSATITGFTGMTQGSILFAGAAGALTQDNTHLFFDNTNDRLGLGTVTPNVGVQLHQSAAAVNWLQFTNATTGSTGGDGLVIGQSASTTAAYIRQRENANLALMTNDTDRIIIDNNGLVGVGVSPSYKLDVLGASTSGITTAVQIIGGTGTSAGGLKLGAYDGTQGGFWSAAVTPSSSNFALLAGNGTTDLGAGTTLFLDIGTTAKATINATTTLFDQSALSGSQTTNAYNFRQTVNTSGVLDIFKITITDTSSSGSSKFFSVNGGAAGTTSLFSVNPSGSGTFANQVITGGQIVNGGSTYTISNSSTALDFRGGSTGVAQNFYRFNNLANATHTTGTGNNISLANAAFVPSGAGDGVYRAMSLNYSLTGTAGAQTGTATGYFLNATETTLNGMIHNLIDLQVGGTSKFKVDNTGLATATGGITTHAININGAVSNQLTFNLGSGAAGKQVYFSGSATAPTSGTVDVVAVGNNGFSPTSGTAVQNLLTLGGTFNQTGGANGITRGLYINPTLTATADFRAIETTNGKVVFGTDTVRVTTAKTPSSASDTCVTGDQSWDTGYVYVCVGTNTWKRAALTTW